MDIRGRSAIVTGGASGLGAAVVDALLERGAKVVVADLQAPKRDLGSDAKHVTCDVSDEESVQKVVDAAVAMDPLGALFNCAGIAVAQKTVGRKGPHELNAFAKVVTVNLVGSFNTLRLAAWAMKDNEPNEGGERGVVVNTASVAAFEGQIGQVAYAASKGGVVGMTLPAARELARTGIRVNTIAPGLFDTPMLAGLPEDARRSLGEQVPFPSRLGQPTEFAKMAMDILANPMLNGTVIRLDGALRMGPK